MPDSGQASAAEREAARHAAASREPARGAAEAAGAKAAPPEPDGSWLGRLLKAVGVEHEHQLAKFAGRPDAGPERQLKEALELPLSVQLSPGDTPDDAARPAADSLKSLLLQLTSADDVPAALKDTAQQALQQVTGQQLLLTNDKAAMFSHITMFIPFMDGSGQQSAAVHIQSRKGKRGEMDADNCRLLFDLQMKAMGSTLVDVQVVNRIVSLHVHNDHPAVAELIEGARDEVAAAMNKAGFQFLSLKCSPFPELRTAKEADAAPGRLADGAKVDPRSFYQPKPYKGVDYRA
uniref:Hook-length control protein FliK n=3 Tax=Paenibacillus athensensis TaxID=1967502 RepID=A0A4Y8PQ11_9BACL